MPTIRCPNCSTPLNAPREAAGRKARCTACKRSFILRFEQKPDAAEPAPAVARKPVAATAHNEPDAPDEPGSDFPHFDTAVPAEPFGGDSADVAIDHAPNGSGPDDEFDFWSEAPPASTANPSVKRARRQQKSEPAATSHREDAPRTGVDPFAAAAFGMSICLLVYMSPLLAPVIFAMTAGLLCAALARFRISPLVGGTVLTFILMLLTVTFMAGHFYFAVERELEQSRKMEESFRGMRQSLDSLRSM